MTIHWKEVTLLIHCFMIIHCFTALNEKLFEKTDLIDDETNLSGK